MGAEQGKGRCGEDNWGSREAFGLCTMRWISLYGPSVTEAHKLTFDFFVVTWVALNGVLRTEVKEGRTMDTLPFYISRDKLIFRVLNHRCLQETYTTNVCACCLISPVSTVWFLGEVANNLAQRARRERLTVVVLPPLANPRRHRPPLHAT